MYVHTQYARFLPTYIVYGVSILSIITVQAIDTVSTVPYPPYPPSPIMTSHLPSLTLPSFVFENPAIAILLPVVCGTATGFAISRKKSILQVQRRRPGRRLTSACSQCLPDRVPHAQAAASASTGLRLRASMDGAVCHHGLHRVPCLHHGHRVS